MYNEDKMITSDFQKAQELRELYRKSNLNSFKFAKKYFSECPYRFVKNTLDFARDIEFGFPIIIKENIQ